MSGWSLPRTPRMISLEVMLISIATEVRKMAGFTDEEIERLVRTTQRSAAY